MRNFFALEEPNECMRMKCLSSIEINFVQFASLCTEPFSGYNHLHRALSIAAFTDSEITPDVTYVQLITYEHNPGFMLTLIFSC